MRLILFLIMIFQSIMIYGQVEDFNQTIKKLVATDFKSMEIFLKDNSHLIINKMIVHDRAKRQIIINDYSLNKEENLKEIRLKTDMVGNVIEELKVFEGSILEVDKVINKEYSSKKSYQYDDEKIEISTFNNKSEIYSKEIVLLDNKGRKVESITAFTTSNDIIISTITKYKWNESGFDIERKQFSYPKQTLIGSYTLNDDGYCKSFKGYLTVNKKTEDFSGDWVEKTNKYDSKGNIIQVYKMENGNKVPIEERKIIY